jgi:hypothetical protein
MPGEDDETIRETIEFVKEVSGSLYWCKNRTPIELVSINYAQALPGTPLYEWARERKYIGQSVDDEESYLIGISDTDAYSEDHFINYTGLPLLRVLMWRYWILAELDAHIQRSQDPRGLSLTQVLNHFLKAVAVRLYPKLRKISVGYDVNRKNIRSNESMEANNEKALKELDLSDSGYFNIKRGSTFSPLLLHPISSKLFFPLLAIAVAIAKGGSLTNTLRLLTDYVVWTLKEPKMSSVNPGSVSLRKVANIIPTDINASHLDPTLPLRKGR